MRFQNTADGHTLTQPRKNKDSQKVNVNKTENSDALEPQYLMNSNSGEKLTENPPTPIVIHLQQGQSNSIPKFKSRKTKLKPNKNI